MSPRLRLLRLRLRLWAALWPALAVVFALVADGRCAHADTPVPVVDAATNTLATDLCTLGRKLVQQQMPKGAPPLPETHPMVRRACAAAAIVADETIGMAPTVRVPFARATFTMAGFESGWQANPKGSNDAGGACGALQLHAPEIFYQADVTCAMLRADLRLGLRAGMAVLLDLTAKHGSLAAGLTAYATNGTYHGWVLPEIRRRCTLAGVDCAAVKL